MTTPSVDPDEIRFENHRRDHDPILLAQQQRDDLARMVYRLDSLRGFVLVIVVLLGLILWRVW